MAFITIEDFKTHLKEYVIEAISDNDEEILKTAITSAEQTAASYISRFDVAAIYATEGADRDKYADLMTYIKDIAKWRFINLVNVATDLDMAESNYKNAIAELGKIQAMRVEPQGWPLPETEANATPFTVASNPKRRTQF
nr:hypothetical protein [Mucilaginibacter sp. L294]